MVRWGILGAGKIAHTFVNDMVYVNNGVVQAVASRSLESATEFALRYAIPTAHGSYQDLYADPNIDAIYIATPHNFHLQQTLSSLSANKSVLCEKPITVSPNQCVELMHKMRKSDSSVMEAMWTYFLPAIQQAQTWVAEGRIGKLVHIKADFGFAMEYEPERRLYNPDLAGGCLLDMGIYPIALMSLFTKGNPQGLKVRASFAETGVEDSLQMKFGFDGLVANLSASFKEKLPNNAYLIGESGIIEIPNFWSATQCKLYHGTEVVEEFDDGRLGSGFEFQIESFGDNILNKQQESSIMPLDTSLRLQTLMFFVRAKLSKLKYKLVSSESDKPEAD